MSYNRRNILLRIIDIQAIYKKHSKNFEGGCTDRHIYEKIIFPAYRISRSRFYEYLRTPAARELQQLEADAQKQLSMF
jgi:hypothetical protein